MLIPHSGEGGLLALLVLAVAPMAFIGAINPSLSAATVTAVIVLLVPAMNHANPLDSTIDRLFEVTVGALTGLGLVPGVAVAGDQPDPHQCGAASGTAGRRFRRIARGLDARARQRRTAPYPGRDRHGDGEPPCDGLEAERERATHLSPGPDTGPLLRTIQRLRHDVVMIGRASVVPLPANVQARLARPLSEVSKAIVGYMRAAAASLRNGSGAVDIQPVDAALQAYAAEVAALRSEGLIRGVPVDAAERFSRWDFRWSRCART